MTTKEVLEIAMRQSAEDNGCRAEDFVSGKNVVFPFKLGKNARKYYMEPITCNLISYGSNVVAAVSDEVAELVKEYTDKFEFYHCFETPNMHWLNERLEKLGHRVCFMAECFLPNVEKMPELDCPYETRILGPEDFKDLYLPQWSNAICSARKERDVLGVGAYDNDKLVGLAGCSADCDDMWQIGVDVLPEYRRNGIASALTNKLAKEILARGKVPFYCCAWSNIRSARNAIRSGLLPTWVEMTAKPVDIVNEMNA